MRAGMMTASNTTETRHCPNRRRLLSARFLISSSNDSPTTAMTDIAIQAALDGKVDEWMERVTTSERASVRQMRQKLIDNFPSLLWLFQPWHVATFVDERECRIGDQRVRFTNIRFARQILSPLKEKNGSSDGSEFRPDVILSLDFKKGRGNAEIVIVRVKFR